MVSVQDVGHQHVTLELVKVLRTHRGLEERPMGLKTFCLTNGDRVEVKPK